MKYIENGVPIKQSGGTIKKDSRNWLERSGDNMLGKWNQNKPQFFKDFPVTDVITPTLTYVTGNTQSENGVRGGMIPVIPGGTASKQFGKWLKGQGKFGDGFKAAGKGIKDFYTKAPYEKAGAFRKMEWSKSGSFVEDGVRNTPEWSGIMSKVPKPIDYLHAAKVPATVGIAGAAITKATDKKKPKETVLDSVKKDFIKRETKKRQKGGTLNFNNKKLFPWMK